MPSLDLLVPVALVVLITAVYITCFFQIKRYPSCCKNAFSKEIEKIENILGSWLGSRIMRGILWGINYSYIALDPFQNIIRFRNESDETRTYKFWNDLYLFGSLIVSGGLYCLFVYYWKEKCIWCLSIFIWRTLTICLSYLKTITDFGAYLRTPGIRYPIEDVTRTILLFLKSILELSICYGFFYFFADVVTSNFLLNALAVFATQGIESHTFNTSCLAQQFILFTQLLVLMTAFILFVSSIFSFSRK